MANRTDVQLGLSDNELGLSDYSLQTGPFGSHNLRISPTRPTLDITLKIQHASSVASVYRHWMASGLLWTKHPFGAKCGVSADVLHGFGRFNVQNASRREGIRRHGSADHVSRLEEEGRRDGQ